MNQILVDQLPPVEYKNRWIRAVLILAAAHIITVIGDPRGTLELLTKKGYWLGMLFSILMAFAIVLYIHLLVRFLDRKYDWQRNTVERLLLQVCLCFILPALVDFLCAWPFINQGNVHILKSSFVTYDFQFVLMMLLVLNLYYIGYYLVLRWRQAAWIIHGKDTNGHTEKAGYLSISHGDRFINIPIDSICYFYRRDNANYIHTFEGSTYYLNMTLDDVSNKLNANFFRLNRQFIVNFHSIKSFRAIGSGKILADLVPPPGEEAVVSQVRAKHFRSWMSKLGK